MNRPRGVKTHYHTADIIHDDSDVQALERFDELRKVVTATRRFRDEVSDVGGVPPPLPFHGRAQLLHNLPHLRLVLPVQDEIKTASQQLRCCGLAYTARCSRHQGI